MIVIALFQGEGGFKYLNSIKPGFSTIIYEMCGFDLMIHSISDNDSDEKLVKLMKIWNWYTEFFLDGAGCLLSTLYCDNFSVIFSQFDYFHQKGVRMEFRKKYAWNRNILGKHLISLFFVQTGEIGWIEVVGFWVFHILRPQTNFLKLILTYANFTRRRVPPSPRLQTRILITKISANIAENPPVSFLLLATHFHCCSPAVELQTQRLGSTQ